MRIIKSIFEWIFNPISKSIEVSNVDKVPKLFQIHPSLIVLISLIVTALIVLGVYYIN